MADIIFAYYWGKDRTKSWSGTPMGIHTALSRKVRVNDVDITYSKIDEVNLTLAKIFYRLLRKDSCYLPAHIIRERNLNRELNQMELGNSGSKMLLFDELNTPYIRNSFVYQDMTINYLLEMRQNYEDLLKYTPLKPWTLKSTVKKRYDRVVHFYRDCGGVFTMSHFLCDYMRNSGLIEPERVHFAGGGCNINEKCVDTSQKNGRKFLFVGRDFERKNGPLVLEAFNKVRGKYGDVELYIAGPRSLVPYMPLPDGTIFLGDKSYQELIYYYNLCDFFVMPSRFEAYGIVFGEALIYGLPCIGKNCFAMPEFIQNGENGFLIDSDNSDELAEKMILLLENRDIAKTVISDHSLYVKQYSWDTVAERIIEVLDK